MTRFDRAQLATISNAHIKILPFSDHRAVTSKPAGVSTRAAGIVACVVSSEASSVAVTSSPEVETHSAKIFLTSFVDASTPVGGAVPT